MTLKVIQFISLFLTGVATGVSVSHLIQWAPKSTIPGAVFLDIHQVLIGLYGPVVGAIETSALIFASVLAYLTRRRRKVFVLNLVAATAVGAMIAVWAIWINPVNQLVNGWTPATLPVDWSEYRDRWHLLHAIRLTLASVGLSALILGLLADHRGSEPHVREPGRVRTAGGSGRQRPAHA